MTGFAFCDASLQPLRLAETQKKDRHSRPPGERNARDGSVGNPCLVLYEAENGTQSRKTAAAGETG